ncbi:MAG: GNAT family N-acetyltransferase [Candidatus Pseudobacter hemicellulosilyticus]|uniref:GNAT family N-acetyltransferase n=1 Tax=Candidatus Pseudobacter hemicellulosilyticus TaxID=3121375 RepID=A0AAJ5WP24_9BACT|nr:MAG: GNAT family N-acetyltransferase [Pseudobacter sp.]
MSAELVIRFAEPEDLATIGYLAQQIWPVTYKEILTEDQIRYMMELSYSPASLQKQLLQQKHRFVLAELEEEPLGFASFSAQDSGVYKLHKIYVHPDSQGKGLGKALISFVADQAKEEGGNSLQLNVNRYNKAKDFYQHYGFRILREEDIDIGNNYFMNDYIMELPLETAD